MSEQQLGAQAAPQSHAPYPWLRHLVLCLPLLLVILACSLTRGWNYYGDFNHFLSLRDAHTLVTSLMRFCSNWIYPIFIVFWLALLFWSIYAKQTEQRRFMLRFVLVMVLAGVALPQLLKHVLAMPRPGVEGVSPGWLPSDLFKSFPSGHTSAIVGLALPLALRYPRLALQLGAALSMALVGYSRIWLLRHHPLDLFAGFLVGSLVSLLAWQGTALLPQLRANLSFARKKP